MNYIGQHPHTLRYRLLKAICENDLEHLPNTLDDYLKRHSLNYIVDWKYELSPLMLATLLNKTAMIEYLVFRGANIDFQNSKGRSPLMVGLE